MKSVGAVLAGFLAVVVLSTGTDAVLHAAGVFPPARMSDGLFAVATLYRTAFTVLGGWITAKLAPKRPWVHVGVLAALGTLGGAGGVAAAVAQPEMGPLWYPVALLVEAIPCVLLGGWLARR
ncbi:MAG: hypothetical protein R3F59_13035 [Myxococcota bacterium]